ncbi:sensor domain-containing protein [Halohasta salina]|uniref:sensor domain-containing protein n=1 Tax=Halohasta salina TaxID=2961621 RepID=UPI0020A467B4|nr:sensor domain-containing protein [Halohasta salina]
MTDSRTQFPDALVQFLAVPFDGDTYRRLLYLVIACPLAVAYFLVTSTGLSVGVGLSVTVIGLPILLVTLVTVTWAAWFESYLARRCLDRESATPVALTGLRMDLDAEDIGIYTACKRFVTDPSTWTSLGLVAVKSVFGLVAFIVLVTLTTVVATLIAAPALYDNPEFPYQVATYTVDTLPEAVGLSVAGVLLGLASLHLLNAIAEFGGLLTESLLAAGHSLEERPR